MIYYSLFSPLQYVVVVVAIVVVVVVVVVEVVVVVVVVAVVVAVEYWVTFQHWYIPGGGLLFCCNLPGCREAAPCGSIEITKQITKTFD